MVNRIKFRLNHHLLLIHQKKNNLQLSTLEVLSLMENFKWITFLVSVIRNTNFGSHHVINIKFSSLPMRINNKYNVTNRTNKDTREH
jgi:hypothetical protein